LTPYLDASVVVSLIVHDVHTGRARALAAKCERFLVSDLTAAEFSSALAIRLRARTLADAEVRASLLLFDAWRLRSADTASIVPADIREADEVIRRLDTTLRAPDAIHVVIAKRLGAPLATFDVAMARDARLLAVNVVET
jgi:uncharacterized protein